MRDDKVGVFGIHRQRAAEDDLAGEVAGPLQDIVHSRPMHGEEDRIRGLCRLARRAGLRIAVGGAGELVQLLLAAGIAEDDFMPRPREERAELAAHQSGTENAYTHGSPPLLPLTTLRRPAQWPTSRCSRSG